MKSLILLVGCVAALVLGGMEDVSANKNNVSTKSAIFAGGCFWCMQHPFDQLAGVISTTPGYAGGASNNPTYEQVSGGGTGHAEVVLVVFDSSKVTYKRLLEVFWKNIDPTDAHGQFCDKGSQYRSGIFYLDDEQKADAEFSLEELKKSKPFSKVIVTEISNAGLFFAAEEYHIDYYKKNPIRYKYYRYGCGRDNRLKQLWGAG